MSINIKKEHFVGGAPSYTYWMRVKRLEKKAGGDSVW